MTVTKTVLSDISYQFGTTSWPKNTIQYNNPRFHFFLWVSSGGVGRTNLSFVVFKFKILWYVEELHSTGLTDKFQNDSFLTPWPILYFQLDVWIFRVYLVRSKTLHRLECPKSTSRLFALIVCDMQNNRKKNTCSQTLTGQKSPDSLWFAEQSQQKKIPSEMEVAPHCTLHTLLTLLTWFKMVDWYSGLTP